MGDPPVHDLLSVLGFRDNEPNMLSRERWTDEILDFVRAERSETSDELFVKSGLPRSDSECGGSRASPPESKEERTRASGEPSGERFIKGGVRGGVIDLAESSESRLLAGRDWPPFERRYKCARVIASSMTAGMEDTPATALETVNG